MLIQAPQKIPHLDTSASSDVVKEAKQIRHQQEQRNVQYLESAQEAIAWIEPFAFSHKVELCLASFELKEKTIRDEKVWAMGNSPSWFANLAPSLDMKHIKHFNYSGKIYYDIYLSIHNPELLDEEKSAVVKAFGVDHIHGLRQYLTAKQINPASFLAQEKIHIVDYIHSGTSLLSFLLMMSHWAHDMANDSVTTPQQWLEKNDIKVILKPIIDKVSLTEIGSNRIVPIKNLEDINWLLNQLKTRVHAQLLPGQSHVRYYLTHNQLPSLGLQLPPKLWDKAQRWLVYEQYPDRHALKALQEMKVLSSMIESLVLMEQQYAPCETSMVLSCMRALMHSHRSKALNTNNFTNIVCHEISKRIQDAHFNKQSLEKQITQTDGALEAFVQMIYNKVDPMPTTRFSGFQSARSLKINKT